MFFSTIGGDGIPQYPSDGYDFHSGFIVHVKVLAFTLVLPKICSGKTKGLGTLPIYIRKPHVLFHYWRRREPPLSLRGDDSHSGFIVHVNFLVFIFVSPKICNGKTKGLGTFPIYIRKSHVFFHYWRRRDPPVRLRGGDFYLSFTATVMFLVLILERPTNN